MWTLKYNLGPKRLQTHSQDTKSTFNFVMVLRLSAHLSAWNTSAPTGRIFHDSSDWDALLKSVYNI
jgi:hypothetical protein